MGLYSKITNWLDDFFCEHVIAILLISVSIPIILEVICIGHEQTKQTNRKLDTLQINDSTYVINAIYYHCDKMTAVKIKEFTK